MSLPNVSELTKEFDVTLNRSLTQTTKQNADAVASIPVTLASVSATVNSASFRTGFGKLERALDNASANTWQALDAYDNIKRYVTDDDAKDAIAALLARHGSTIGSMNTRASVYSLYGGKPMFPQMTFARHQLIAPLVKASTDERISVETRADMVKAISELANFDKSLAMRDSGFKALVERASARCGLVKKNRTSKKVWSFATASVVCSGSGDNRILTATVKLSTEDIPANGVYKLTVRS